MRVGEISSTSAVRVVSGLSVHISLWQSYSRLTVTSVSDECQRRLSLVSSIIISATITSRSTTHNMAAENAPMEVDSPSTKQPRFQVKKVGHCVK